MNTVKTKLSLPRFAELLGISPIHFGQVYLENLDVHCQDIWTQKSWQNADHVSREELAEAILEAETNLESQLGYRLAPTWEVDEWQETIRPFRNEFANLSVTDIRGLRQTIKANWGYFISGGIQSKALLEADSAITYSDVNNDGYFETATVTLATTVQDKNEICLFYPGKDGEDPWEIRPINVVISSGVATITFRRELVVIEDKLETMDREDLPVLGTDDALFLDEVDVYRRYNDPQVQASFLWEPFSSSCGCGSSGCATCAYSVQAGCLIVRGDPRQSIVGYWPANWNSDTLDFDRAWWSLNRQPDIIRLYYYSGWRDKTQKYVNRLDPKWERTVAFYAASMLDRSPCTCCNEVWRHWREDLAISSGDEDGLATFSDIQLESPLGTRRGAVNAWRRLHVNDTTEPIARAVHF